MDIALDLFVHPDFHYTVLDEDEFADAAGSVYNSADIQSARAGLDELIRLAEERRLPAPEIGEPTLDLPLHGG